MAGPDGIADRLDAVPEQLSDLLIEVADEIRYLRDLLFPAAGNGARRRQATGSGLKNSPSSAPSPRAEHS